jgi:hypothetical protein
MRAQNVSVTELSESIEQTLEALLWKLEQMGYGLYEKLGPDSVVPQKALDLLGYKKKEVVNDEDKTLSRGRGRGRPRADVQPAHGGG